MSCYFADYAETEFKRVFYFTLIFEDKNNYFKIDTKWRNW